VLRPRCDSPRRPAAVHVVSRSGGLTGASRRHHLLGDPGPSVREGAVAEAQAKAHGARPTFTSPSRRYTPPPPREPCTSMTSSPAPAYPNFHASFDVAFTTAQDDPLAWPSRYSISRLGPRDGPDRGSSRCRWAPSFCRTPLPMPRSGSSTGCPLVGHWRSLGTTADEMRLDPSANGTNAGRSREREQDLLRVSSRLERE